MAADELRDGVVAILKHKVNHTPVALGKILGEKRKDFGNGQGVVFYGGAFVRAGQPGDSERDSNVSLTRLTGHTRT